MNPYVRARILGPAALPLVALLFIGTFTWSISRVLLAVDKEAAVVVAVLVALDILVGAAVIAARPRIRTSVLAGVLLLTAGSVVASGLVASEVVGERPIGAEEAEAAKAPERKTAPPPAGPEGAGGPAEVDVVDDRFDPPNLTVAAGATVVWEQTGTNPHTVTADDESFDSHPDCKSFGDLPRCMKRGDTFEQTFDKPGRFPYYCRIHGAPGGAGMAGVIVVE